MEETGEERRFIEDGDTVILSGYCQGKGYRVGFGSLMNTVLPGRMKNRACILPQLRLLTGRVRSTCRVW